MGFWKKGVDNSVDERRSRETVRQETKSPQKEAVMKEEL